MLGEFEGLFGQVGLVGLGIGGVLGLQFVLVLRAMWGIRNFWGSSLLVLVLLRVRDKLNLLVGPGFRRLLKLEWLGV